MCTYISCLAFFFAPLHVLIGLFRVCTGGGVGVGLRGEGLRSHNQDIDERIIVEKGCFVLEHALTALGLLQFPLLLLQLFPQADL